MKRILLIALAIVMLLSSVTAAEEAVTYSKFRHYFFNTFDTIVTLTGYTHDQEEFDIYAEITESQMQRYHRIYDLYYPYEGVNNLYYVNKNAGNAPVAAESELIDLLLLIKEWRVQYGEKLNPAMGSVLTLWHDAREEGSSLPSQEALDEAAKHMNFDQVIIDQEAQTIYFEDPLIKLDLGAVAKGYAAELVAQELRREGLCSFLINAGGNVVCGDAPLDGRDSWTIAVEDLDAVTTKEKLLITSKAVVTSGDYQRYYEVNEKRYHHLIDPDTLYPADYMHAVTIVHPDSGLSDFLSTIAFLLPYEESRTLIESIDDAEAMWTLMDGTTLMTEGFETLIKPE
ncbi:MAG: FAD:protein FMN transferase [Clostridiales bacterium]|nr:FAD:protein FMN transferase [Clostridiales bacterium]